MFVLFPFVSGKRIAHFTPMLAQKRHDFRKKLLKHKMCILIFCTTFVRNISHSKKNSARCYHKSTVVFTLSIRYYCQIVMKFGISSTGVRKNPLLSNSMKIRSVGSEFRAERHADGWTDMTQLIVASRNFANASKIHFTLDRKLTASSLQRLLR